MAIIYKRSLFSWKDVDCLGDLERLKIVIENMPDEKLMHLLEKKRKSGRNNYPVRAVWNSLLAGIVFQHTSIQSLRRELLRNSHLREMCGLDVVPGLAIVPSSWVFSRFLKALFQYQKEIDTMFDGLVKEISALLPGFAKKTARGLTKFCYQDIAGRIDPRYVWLNWEQDLGIAGLRKAKRSFCPACLARKGRLHIPPQS